MFEIFGLPSQALFGQLLLGLINGSFYALLSLGLAVIFGMLNIINFSHGAQYMMGAFAAFILLRYTGIGYWPALIIVPIVVGATGVVIERLFLRGLSGHAIPSRAVSRNRSCGKALVLGVQLDRFDHQVECVDAVHFACHTVGTA